MVSTFINGNIHAYIFYEERLAKQPYICVYMCAHVWWFCKPFLIENFPSLKCRKYHRRGQRERESQRMGGVLRNVVSAVHANSHSWLICTRLAQDEACSDFCLEQSGFPVALPPYWGAATNWWLLGETRSLFFGLWLLVGCPRLSGWLYAHVHMGRVTGHSRL